MGHLGILEVAEVENDCWYFLWNAMLMVLVNGLGESLMVVPKMKMEVRWTRFGYRHAMGKLAIGYGIPVLLVGIVMKNWDWGILLQ